MWSIIHLSDGDDYGLYRVGSRNPEGGHDPLARDAARGRALAP